MQAVQKAVGELTTRASQYILWQVNYKQTSDPKDLPASRTYGLRALGVTGNGRASRIWKGDCSLAKHDLLILYVGLD